MNKNNEDASVSAIKLIADDSIRGSWGPPLTKKLKVDHAEAMLKYSMRIENPAFTCKVFDPPKLCFVLASDKGILCKFCILHNLGAAALVKSDQQHCGSAFPTQKKAMTKHLESGRHKASVSIEKVQQTSIFEKQAVQVKQAIQQTVVKRIHSIYFIAKNEMANHKFRSLQHLIEKVGHNEDLKNFGYYSSCRVYEFLV